MSRTYRRNKKHLINGLVGTYDECKEEPWYTMYRYPTLTFDQAYERKLARYTRDHHQGHYGVPRWFRRMHGSKHVRLAEKCKLHNCRVSDSWEQHLPDSRMRNAKWYWY